MKSGSRLSDLQENKTLLAGCYLYLMLPISIFLLGWCKWYVSFPVVAILVISVFFSLREHDFSVEKISLNASDKRKCLAILLLVMTWVALAGIGGYTWQNDDHAARNTIFDILVNDAWPVRRSVLVEGVEQERGLVYYVGFWLPAALAGKLWGIQAGYAVQYIWAVVGILLFYALICVWRKKVTVWPLVLIVFFSGWDAMGVLLNSAEEFQIFGTAHLEWWAKELQFSSMTTQLFWVFNQAVPAWLAVTLLFLVEKPRNMVFLSSLIMITSTLPFIGLLPYLVVLMVSKSDWRKNKNVVQLCGNIWKNWGSFQNVAGGCTVGIISFLYLSGNYSGQNLIAVSANIGKVAEELGKHWFFAVVLFCFVLVLLWAVITLWLSDRKRILVWVTEIIFSVWIISVVWKTLLNNNSNGIQVYNLTLFAVFYLLEVGIYLICLYGEFGRDRLFGVTVIWLALIPFIKVGYSNDFCMRASIPALLLVMLWCIQALDGKKKNAATWILIMILLVGAVTPLHEIKRTLVNSKEEYKVEKLENDTAFAPGNFSGSTDCFFWEILAR